MIRVVRDKFKEEIFFIVTFLLALLTSLFSGVNLGAIDFHVIISLFTLMGFALVFEKTHLLDALAVMVLKKAKSERQIGYLMIFLTALLGMLITNDVALITIVPLTLLLSKRANFSPLYLVIIETLAANIGSSLTPFGNPQNLYLFSTYGIQTMDFFKMTSPFVIMGLIFVCIYNLKRPSTPIVVFNLSVPFKWNKRVIGFCVLFTLQILAILRVLPFNLISAISILLLFIYDRKLMLKIDYFLLGTFISCFIFIDNISNWHSLQDLLASSLNSPLNVFISAGLLSQIISNVPASILISGFTDEYYPLLLGVSVGGMGTMIASLANLISYKFYIKYDAHSEYKKKFLQINTVGFVLFLTIFSLYFFIKPS